MKDVKLNLNESGKSAFQIMDGTEQVGEMVVGTSGTKLTVYHTEVSPKAQGKGLAKELLSAMVTHARKNSLQVVPVCSYVRAQFSRHPEEYADVWNGGNEKEMQSA
jgi:predicted GNAT family acetyltransferase